MDYSGNMTAIFKAAKFHVDKQHEREDMIRREELASQNAYYDSQAELNKIKMEKEQLEKELLKMQKELLQLKIDKEKSNR